jgi:putative ABC transport system permease protein
LLLGRRGLISRSGEARYAEGLYVTANFLDVLGVKPTLGRDFTSDDDRQNCSTAGALLSYSFWQREYGGDPAIVGRPVYLSGRMFPVVGVTPPQFFGIEPGRRFDVAVPLCVDALISKDGKGRIPVRHAWWLTPIGRLNPGWSIEKASAHFRDLSPGIFRETVPPGYRPDAAKKYLNNKLKVISASAGLSSLRKTYENPLWILLALTALVLLIACANLANLLLARASAREREIAIRQAVGASRSRLLAQLLSESLLLAAIGAFLGAVLAQVLSRGLVAFLGSGDEGLQVPLNIDWHVFGFTSLLALVTCVLFGLAPAIRATRTSPATAMHGGRGSTATVERNGLRRALVVSQIALSLVLLVGALLFGRSLHNLLNVDPGIVSNGVLVASVDARLPDVNQEHRRVIFEELEQRIKSQPGVVSVSSVFLSPFSGLGWNGRAHAEGDTSPSGGKEVWFNGIGPGYFDTLKTPILRGRDIGRHDDKGAPKVAIVNEHLAKQFFGGANPVGRTFRAEGDANETDPVYQIIGLVKDTKYSGLREDTRAIAFLPLAQQKEFPERITYMVRAQGSLSGAMAGVRQSLSGVQAGLLVEFRVLDVQVANSVLRERLMANLSGAFGVLAALLSILGLYGVMSYMVARRRNEIGVRMALGAQPGDVLRLMFGEAGRLVAIGLALGLAGSFAVSRYAESLLFGLKPNDAWTLALGCALLACTAIAASLIPARRAAKLDPAIVLRDE